MRMGKTRSGSAKRVETVCRPSQRTGWARPSEVSTRSPRLSVSTATSPSGVRIIVPAMKQMVSVVTRVVRWFELMNPTFTALMWEPILMRSTSVPLFMTETYLKAVSTPLV